jgi:hypothetical protein
MVRGCHRLGFAYDDTVIAGNNIGRALDLLISDRHPFNEDWISPDRAGQVCLDQSVRSCKSRTSCSRSAICDRLTVLQNKETEVYSPFRLNFMHQVPLHLDTSMPFNTD